MFSTALNDLLELHTRVLESV